MWEVFNPHDGLPIITTRSEMLARFAAWLLNADYEKQGKGWIIPYGWDSID